MPNIKSAMKRVKVTRAKTLQNNMSKSALKTTIRKCKEALDKKDAAVADTYKTAVQAIDKAAAKNLIHKNTAARRKSRLAKVLNTINTK